MEPISSSTGTQPVEQPQDWFFTFGYDHFHPVTGESLDKRYVRVHGTCDSTRLDVLAVFGRAWSSQYTSEQKPRRIDKYNLTEITIDGAPVSTLDGGL